MRCWCDDGEMFGRLGCGRGARRNAFLSANPSLRHCWVTLTAPCIPCVNNK